MAMYRATRGSPRVDCRFGSGMEISFRRHQVGAQMDRYQKLTCYMKYPKRAANPDCDLWKESGTKQISNSSGNN